jgi:hypothetical protein
MAPKTMKKTTTKAAPKKPRMSKSAARAEGAQRTRAAKAPKERKPKRLSGLDLAAKVLADAGQPLNANSIAERAISAGWKTNGKTPGATLYAAIIREIARKGKDARFAKHDRGLFTAGKGA